MKQNNITPLLVKFDAMVQEFFHTHFVETKKDEMYTFTSNPDKPAIMTQFNIAESSVNNRDEAQTQFEINFLQWYLDTKFGYCVIKNSTYREEWDDRGAFWALISKHNLHKEFIKIRSNIKTFIEEQAK